MKNAHRNFSERRLQMVSFIQPAVTIKRLFIYCHKRQMFERFAWKMTYDLCYESILENCLFQSSIRLIFVALLSMLITTLLSFTWIHIMSDCDCTGTAFILLAIPSNWCWHTVLHNLCFPCQHHIKYQHLLKKKYVCPHPSCGRLFRLQKQLLRHAKHHTGTCAAQTENRHWVWSVWVFVIIYYLENTSIFVCFVVLDQRDYICEFCARAFKSSHNLAVHRMIHTGEKPLQWVLCIRSLCFDIF